MDEIHLSEDVGAEMHDGTVLAADIYRPEEGIGSDAEEGLPTLVTRTPYDKREKAEIPTALARRGFAVVVQDVRGKFASEGTFYPYRSGHIAEGQDGYDTVEWAAARPWSNGRVGTFGISYAGGTQWTLAHNDELPPSLEAMDPASRSPATTARARTLAVRHCCLTTSTTSTSSLSSASAGSIPTAPTRASSSIVPRRRCHSCTGISH